MLDKEDILLPQCFHPNLKETPMPWLESLRKTFQRYVSETLTIHVRRRKGKLLLNEHRILFVFRTNLILFVFSTNLCHEFQPSLVSSSASSLKGRGDAGRRFET